MLDRGLSGQSPVPDVGRGEHHADRIVGLTAAEVRRRHEAGQGNDVEQRTARSTADIIKANTLTRFNAIIATLTVVVLVFGDPIDAVFGLVMVLNSAIGVSQELRAKRSLDALRVLLVPSIGVIRDGRSQQVPPSELVAGDAVKLQPGDQVPVDGVVLASQGLEVDESALTGESNPIPKRAGDETLSGSFVIAGTATIEATAVGASSWAARITAEAKDFVLTKSELRVGIDRLLRTVSWLLPPISALLIWSQLKAEASLDDGFVSAVAGVVALVPQGLILLVSMTFAIAVIRLAKKEVVVQELPAVEGLARIDVLCVDKTGTLTTGRLSVDSVSSVEATGGTDGTDGTDGADGTDGVDGAPGLGTAGPTLRAGLAALAQLETARSATTEALQSALVDDIPDWSTIETVPFSSVRKWSGATFDGHGTWVLGAPEILLDAMEDRPIAGLRAMVDDLASSGRRVLLVARGDSGFTARGDSGFTARGDSGFTAAGDSGEGEHTLPEDLRPCGLAVLKEEVRPDAAETIEYFRRQHVEIKVLSGDNPRTVAAVAAELGIDGSEHYVDMRSSETIAEIPPTTAVFGRVLPEQKRDIVRMLQAQGHTVAMTGDGVNDIPSLKAADIGIAMNTATPATKASSQLVLLDGRFDHLPTVVGEGRRVIANMERVSSLFVTKTVYAALLAVVVGVVGVSFPFLPRHLSLIGALTIGIPGFVLSFLPSNEPSRPGYLRRVLHFSIPAGVVAATATFATFWAARSPLGGADLVEARTAATLAMTMMGLWILYRLIHPLNLLKAALLATLVGLLVMTLVPAPWSDFYALRLPSPRTTAVLVAVLAATIGVLQIVVMVNDRRTRS